MRALLPRSRPGLIVLGVCVALMMVVGLLMEVVGMRVCLFSAVQGVVLNHGQPVAGAVVQRQYHWAWVDRRKQDAVTTDAKGEFTLPAIWGRMWLGAVLPHEPGVEQTILIFHQDHIYNGWMMDKHNYDENGELKKPIHVICNLDQPPARHGPVYGLCIPQ